MKNLFILAVLFFGYLPAVQSSNLQISNTSWNASSSELTFDISWEYSWYFSSGEFSDAAWAFVKYSPNGSSWTHADIASVSSSAAQHTATLSSDNKGIKIKRLVPESSGTASTTITLTFSNLLGISQDFKVFGMEMVDIPAGAFYAGDGYSTLRVYDGNDDTLPFLIPASPGPLNCHSTSGNYNKTSCIDLSADFPKGNEAFSIMKYHVTYQQLIDFLNCISRQQQDTHTPADLSGTSTSFNYPYDTIGNGINGNGIYIETNIGTGPVNFQLNADLDSTPNESNDGHNQSCNFISYQLMAAYLDWAALRPMTFLEFEKAARGPLYPVAGEHSWGSTVTSQASFSDWIDVGSSTEQLINPNNFPGLSMRGRRVGATVPSANGSREISQASYYGVISLGNNASDMVVNDIATSFTNEHGDGQLSLSGQANVPSWDLSNPQNFAIKDSGNVTWRTVSGLFLASSGFRVGYSFRGVR